MDHVSQPYKTQALMLWRSVLNAIVKCVTKVGCFNDRLIDSKGKGSCTEGRVQETVNATK